MLDVTKPPAKAEPQWLTLMPDLDPPVEVQARPASRADRMAAQAAARAVMRNGGDGFEGHVAYVMAMAQRVIVAWKGVGDADGQPVDPTADEKIRNPETNEVVEVIPGTITNLMTLDAAYEAFEADYVLPLLTAEREANSEKKG